MLGIKQLSIKTSGTIIMLTVIALGVTSCKRKNIVSHNGAKDLISFKSIQGISYTEVARRMKNGLAFNEYGYQLEPEWKMSFISDDSARIYSPIKKQLINFPLSRGYDSIFNTARTWLKVKKMNRDSLVLEILKFSGDSIETKGAKVYMIMYADNYIKNVLHSDSVILRHPSKRDTAFIRGLVAKANSNYTKAFAARQPVKLISLSPLASAIQRKTIPEMQNNFDTSDDYLDPTFDIVINKAYKNFYYSFSVYVDDKGEMHYRRALVDFSMSPEFEAPYNRIAEGIMKSYLKLYFKIIPGSTLGMTHASIISIHLKGSTAAPHAVTDTLAKHRD
ncbi:hypothetical protein [Mucilaginibacter polytrichastri]|uniref:Lipoprotein n=1 Tax=Mucilaginibacter polytrichastri TaxID=1302689 RepID=A0A1Q5ZXH6_9SPHI|nr:hypothetical protein [Mucilaginibacter polytrichastri]OKS86475.1 hypothetical protein RG47T_1931 [Mucilaginibacter polytrichastri]SFS78646.1 hypothetical protein SAMN04487890_10451 [Mucilaginibacter polytrichastri]